MYICLQANMVLIFHLVSVWARGKVRTAFSGHCCIGQPINRNYKLFETFIGNLLSLSPGISGYFLLEFRILFSASLWCVCNLQFAILKTKIPPQKKKNTFWCVILSENRKDLSEMN